MPVTLKNELIMPFLTGHQLDLISPLWFVPQLFTSLIIYKIIHKHLNIFWYFIFALIAIQLGKFADNLWILYLLRTMFSLMFIEAGYLYKTKIENKINIFHFRF